MPERPVTPRPDPAAADLAGLVALGRADPPPTPSPDPPQRPGIPQPQPPGENPAIGAHRTMLTDALRDAGVTPDGRDTVAVAELATLTTATVGTVTQWIRRGRPADPEPSRT